MERVELRKSAVVLGDIFTRRIVIEDGAYFKGGIDMQKEASKPQPTSAFVSQPVTPAPAPVSSGIAAAPASPVGAK
jgi:cytoskeletal protein CcmA (bactofilin family)